MDVAVLYAISATEVSSKERMGNDRIVRTICVVRDEPHSATVVQYTTHTLHGTRRAHQRCYIDCSDRYAALAYGQTLRADEISRTHRKESSTSFLTRPREAN